ncbi:MAG: hypothetical protein VX837_04385, partial [Candidatus Thermoplasmatota archaeon]|nr:hypothetical protein [Candidatus Thermoplasmatota archaeon]
MTRIAPLSLALILLTTALAGCLSEDDTSDLAEDTSQNSADIEAVNTELAAVSDAVNTMNTDLETVSDTLGTESALIEMLDARIEVLENVSADNTTDAQIADLKDEIATIVEVLMQLQNGVTALDADLQDIGGTVDMNLTTLDANLSALAADLDTAEAGLAGVAVGLDEIEAGLFAVETQLASLDG